MTVGIDASPVVAGGELDAAAAVWLGAAGAGAGGGSAGGDVAEAAASFEVGAAGAAAGAAESLAAFAWTRSTILFCAVFALDAPEALSLMARSWGFSSQTRATPAMAAMATIRTISAAHGKALRRRGSGGLGAAGRPASPFVFGGATATAGALPSSSGATAGPSVGADAEGSSAPSAPTEGVGGGVAGGGTTGGRCPAVGAGGDEAGRGGGA